MGLNFGFYFYFLGFNEIFLFGSKTLKAHQINGFRSRGPSKNARGYRFHAYKWSNHHITGWKTKLLIFTKCWKRPERTLKR